jgi:predicted nucleotidyltransferase
MRFRDRDAPITSDGLIFRTYGYDHPPNSCFCDLEYAPENLYKSEDPRAVRNGHSTKYYKFYFDGGLKFALRRDPPYELLNEPLGLNMVGVRDSQIFRVMRPNKRLLELLEEDNDSLITACKEVLDLVLDSSSLKYGDFGVFGSLAHRFHNPKYSDIDLIIYGKDQLHILRETLDGLYKNGLLKNEFEDWNPSFPPVHWNFKHYSKKQYGELQKRKRIYATYNSQSLNRIVKVEFEPVRRWNEIDNKYSSYKKITNLGRVDATGEILQDDESGFMPSIYYVYLKEINKNIDCGNIIRVVSFVEEFRLQLQTGESVFMKGNLERIEKYDGIFYQIVLSYGEDYFDQVLLPIDFPR